MAIETSAQPTAGTIPTWASWRNVLLLGGVIFIVRLFYLWVLSPYELAADEAHYWEWGRYLDWSYYTKGPGIGWTNFLSTTLFGVSEGSVRFPAALFSLGTLLVVAKMAWDISGDVRAGFFAAALFALMPGYQAVSQFMTIDMPFFFFWALAAWAAVRVLLSDSQKIALCWWTLLGFSIGVGCLYKYTILLMLPGFAAFLILDRSWLQSIKQHLPGVLLCVLVMMVTMLPIVIWNQQYGWPTIVHLMGHLNMEGGDVGVDPDKQYSPMWTLTMLVEQAGIIGPPIVVLIALGIVRSFRQSKPSPTPAEHKRGIDPALGRRAGLLMLCLGLGIVVFYLLVSFMTPPACELADCGLFDIACACRKDQWG